eukprot:scaffold3416_cov133-Isochrysis_galbana.AAC.2
MGGSRVTSRSTSAIVYASMANGHRSSSLNGTRAQPSAMKLWSVTSVRSDWRHGAGGSDVEPVRAAARSNALCDGAGAARMPRSAGGGNTTVRTQIVADDSIAPAVALSAIGTLIIVALTALTPSGCVNLASCVPPYVHRDIVCVTSAGKELLSTLSSR